MPENANSHITKHTHTHAGEQQTEPQVDETSESGNQVEGQQRTHTHTNKMMFNP